MAGDRLLGFVRPFSCPARVPFGAPVGSVATFAASLAVETGAVVLKGTTAGGRGLFLYEEAGEGDSLVAARREPHHFAHIGADVRFPGEVGPFFIVVDVTHRVGQRVLLWIPVIVRKALV